MDEDDVVGRLRQAVLASWTLTYQREAGYAWKLEYAAEQWRKRLLFSRYKVQPREVVVTFGGREYRVEWPAPEPVDWVPFATLLNQFEDAVRRERVP